MKSLILTLALISTSAFAVDAPDPVLTPGAVRTTDPAEVCSTPTRKIKTSDFRHVTSATAKAVYASYGLTGNHTGYCAVARGCEVDHLISLQLGGSNDATNLWPQPYTGVWNASMKDSLETRLHFMVCRGEITLPEAQRAISKDWKNAWVKYVNRNKTK